MFEDFWKQYPRKIAKRSALKSWQRLSPADQRMALDAIKNHVAYWQASGTESQYIPHASTWLNQGRFEDELEQVKPKEQKANPWWATEGDILKKASEVGVTPRSGESWAELRKRITDKLTVKV